MGRFILLLSETIGVVEKKFIRVITKSSFLAHTEPLFKSTEILNLEKLHKFIVCPFIFKSLSSQNTTFAVAPHSYTTRQQNNLQPKFQRLSVSQKSSTYKAPLMWNSLPTSLRNLRNFSKFKKELKSYLLSL